MMRSRNNSEYRTCSRAIDLLSWILVVATSTGVLAGDTAELRHGGILSGEIKPYARDSDRGQLIQVGPGMTLAIPDAEIRRVRDDDPVIAEYEQLVGKMPDTPEGHWELSVWCNQKVLHAQRERHLRRVIELAPNHGPARQALGYAPQGNGWVLNTALRRERGMLRDGGKWKLAEDVIASKSMRDSELARKEWLQMVPRWKTLAAKGGRNGQDALAQLQAINDPYADEAVAKEFQGAKDSDRFPRAFWLEILMRLRTSIAMNTIVEAGMNDSSVSIRESCLEFLQEFGKEQAIPYYVSRLKDKDNRVVRRAGRALQYLNDPEIALALVDALVTTHVGELPKGNDTNVTMTPSGGGGLSLGGGPTRVRAESRNSEVHIALLELVPKGVDFQYDKQAWRVYFAKQLAPSPGDLRRDL
jgi:hypothetical protein